MTEIHLPPAAWRVFAAVLAGARTGEQIAQRLGWSSKIYPYVMLHRLKGAGLVEFDSDLGGTVRARYRWERVR